VKSYQRPSTGIEYRTASTHKSSPPSRAEAAGEQLGRPMTRRSASSRDGNCRASDPRPTRISHTSHHRAVLFAPNGCGSTRPAAQDLASVRSHGLCNMRADGSNTLSHSRRRDYSTLASRDQSKTLTDESRFDYARKNCIVGNRIGSIAIYSSTAFQVLSTWCCQTHVRTASLYRPAEWQSR
jgi:hypothetical protein